jgi:hypothetical protein
MGIMMFISCTNEDIVEQAVSANRTIIVYMAADNDLSFDALDDIEEMKQGYSETGVNLIVFADTQDEAPYLLQIGQDKETFIKSYPELNSADARTMQSVIQEIVEMYPADEYGLILWSHGTSWMPSGSSLRSSGKDSGKEMNIIDLAKALPLHFNFILFDACLMASVEVAYELKDKADFIIASSTETIYTGFPYDKIIPELLKQEWDLKAVGQCYFDYYNSLQGAYQSATISLIDTKELDDLAALTRKLISEQSFNPLSFDRTSVQRLDIYNEQYAFDFFDFIDKAFPEADKTELIWQLGKAIPYKANTIMFLGEYELNTYCGLSCYIPHPQRSDLNSFYKTLRWHIDSGM